jgi:hypothetical protein
MIRDMFHGDHAALLLRGSGVGIDRNQSHRRRSDHTHHRTVACMIVLRAVSPAQAEIVYDGRGAPIWAAAGAMQKNGQRKISLSVAIPVVPDRSTWLNIVQTVSWTMSLESPTPWARSLSIWSLTIGAAWLRGACNVPSTAAQVADRTFNASPDRPSRVP